jgi:hypothetical protein
MSSNRDKIVDTTDKDTPVKDRVHAQAISRFRSVSNVEMENRSEAMDDLKMLSGEGHWPAKVVRDRELEGRPVLTINKLPGFADRVVNDARVNQLSVKVIPNSIGASQDIADIFNGLIKSIENDSDAEVAYQTALEGAVYSGFGFFRIITSFTDETSFNQEIKIDRIKNNFSVYMDSARTKYDGSDCRFVFVTEMISRDEYKVRYPKLSAPAPLDSDSFNESTAHWTDEDRVRVGEYWVKEPKTKTLLLLDDKRTVDADEWYAALPTMEAEAAAGGPPVPRVHRERTVESHVVKQYFIDGEKVIEGPTEWAGHYIPIIPVWGKEVTIDERTILRGVIRFAKDPQRMYNYFRTAATETVALTPKAPYVVAAEQIEGYEDEWGSANQSNKAYLTYNHVAGLNPPVRQVVTQTAIGEITESNIASDEMKATTSIYDASLGQQGNEVSGRAISKRQAQSDMANFTYPDNLRRSIKYAGRILVDLIPRIYDTERQVVIIDPEERQRFVTVNQTVVIPASGERIVINDLTQGRYGVSIITGPSFNTQREEAAASMMDFIRTAPDAATAVIDLVAENQNWPGATKIANRLRKMFLPPGIDDDQPPPPPEPTIDDILKQLKTESITLGNEKKKLDIVDKRREMTDETGDLIKLTEQLSKLSKMGGTNGQTSNERR